MHAVRRNRRSERRNVPVGYSAHTENHRFPRRTAHSEIEIKPFVARVAQVRFEPRLVIRNFNDFNVSARKIRVYLHNFLRREVLLKLYRRKTKSVKRKILTKRLNIFVFYRLFTKTAHNLIDFGNAGKTIRIISDDFAILAQRRRIIAPFRT